jgi:hypothetical protein
MNSQRSRKLVFAMMIATAILSLFVYAGNSVPWAATAFALPVGGSFPGVPIEFKASVLTPVSAVLTWARSLDGMAPTGYSLKKDNVPVTLTPDTTTTAAFAGLVPGSQHQYEVIAWAMGPSDPATLTLTQPKAPLSVSKPTVPSSGKTSKTIKVSGTLSAIYTGASPAAVTLKFYRQQRKSGKLVWVLRKTVKAARPTAWKYSYSLKLKPAGTWSVIALAGASTEFSAGSSNRSRSIKIK